MNALIEEGRLPILCKNPNNSHNGQFEWTTISLTSVKLKYLVLTTYQCATGRKCLPSGKTTTISFTVNNSTNLYIKYGVCSKAAMGTVNSYSHGEAICYKAMNGTLYGSGLNGSAGGRGIKKEEVVHMVVDLTNFAITWKSGQEILKTMPLPDKLKNQ